MSSDPQNDPDDPELPPPVAPPEPQGVAQAAAEVAAAAAGAVPVERRAADVLLGKGRAHTDHPGNRAYRTMISENIDDYNNARSYADIIRITREIVAHVHLRSGRFLKFNKASEAWFEVDREEARRKVGQDLRNYRRPSSRAREEARARYAAAAAARAVGAAGGAVGADVAALGAVAAVAGESPGRRSSDISAVVRNPAPEEALGLAASLPFPAHPPPDEPMDEDQLLSDEAILAALEEPYCDEGNGDDEAKEGVGSRSQEKQSYEERRGDSLGD